jgi:ATP-dependent Clp protease ATP-binding subunit ClpX
MYEVPSLDKVSKCIITKEAITGEGKPVLEEGERKKKLESKAGAKAAKRVENAS